jgi:hypothetical protein
MVNAKYPNRVNQTFPRRAGTFSLTLNPAVGFPKKSRQQKRTSNPVQSAAIARILFD